MGTRLLRWAELEDVATAKLAGCEDGVGEAADGAMAPRQRRDVPTLRNIREHLRSSVRGACAQTGDLHRGEIVDVVAEEARMFERHAELRRELPQRPWLVARSLGDERDTHLLGVPVYQRRRLAGDQRHPEAKPPKQRDAHDVGERKALGLLAASSPGQRAVRQNAVDIKGDGLQCDELLRVEGHGPFQDNSCTQENTPPSGDKTGAKVGRPKLRRLKKLDSSSDSTKLLHDGNLFLVHRSEERRVG